MTEEAKTEEAKTFYTTEKAGRTVAGRPVPLDDSGKTIPGSELNLTDLEAEYELLLGTISTDKSLALAPEATISQDDPASPATKTDRKSKAAVEAAPNGS